MQKQSGELTSPRDDRRAIVIGAGMVGVCAAWHLQKRGYEVTVVDKKGPGEETSWGNAGLLQRECIHPYAFPTDIGVMITTLLNTRLDVRYQPSALLRYSGLMWQYWRHSFRRPYSQICKDFSALVSHCLEEHEAMMAASQSAALVRRVGFIELFRAKPASAIAEMSKELQQENVNADVLSPADLQRMEPSLTTDGLTGAVHFRDSWQVVDPEALVKAYANSFVQRGGTLVRATVNALVKPAASSAAGERRLWLVQTNAGTFSAPTVVVAAGPWSVDLMRPLGFSYPMYPLRGYNTHLQLADGAVLHHSLVDVGNGFVLGPMRHGVRLTTGGSLTNPSSPIDPTQIDADTKIAKTLLPLREPAERQVWFGHRPCMVDMKPVIGEVAKDSGLWADFGHGHLGLTLGPVSGRLLSELIAGEQPLVEPLPFAPTRFAQQKFFFW